MDKPLYAYIVTEPEEGTGGVIYARSAIEARRRGAHDYGDGDLRGMSCRRAPELDGKRGDERAIIQHLLSLGWWFERGDGHGIMHACDLPFVTNDGEVYPTPYHWLSEVEAKAIMEANDRLFGDWASAKWWFADEISVSRDGRGQYTVTMQLPYLLCSITWDITRPDTVTISACDLRTWRTLYRDWFVGLAEQLPRGMHG